MNPTFKTIHARRSVGNLSKPAPNKDELESLFELAMTAPDHKELKPWRFVVLEDKGKKILADAMVQASIDEAKDKGEKLDDKAQEKLAKKVDRAPMIVVCISDYQEHKKVPKLEQTLTLGAMVQNFLLGLESLGYKSVWKSGLLMNAPAVKKAFNVKGDNEIVGFIYVGSSDIKMPKREKVKLKDFVEYWD